VRPPAPPLEAAAGTTIDALPFADTVGTERAEIHAEEPSLTCGSGSDTVWYAYTATTAGIVVIDTAGSDYDTVIDVWSGELTSDRMQPGFERLVPLACSNDNDGDPRARVVIQTRAGERYVIRVSAGLDSVGGTLRLSVTAG
jgi:hypothetical protein